MKIAVSARGESLQAELDPSFGRSAGFVVYDTTTQATSFLDNSKQQNLPQGAGIQTAQMLSAAGVDVLITGQVGPKAMQALSPSKIQLYASSERTVQEAIDAWHNGQLTPITDGSGQTGPGTDQGMGGGGGLQGRGPDQGGRGMGGGARGRGPGQGGRGMGGGGRGRGPGQGGRGMGGGGRGRA